MEPRHSTMECLQTPYIPCNAYGTTTFNNGMPSDTIYSMQCLWNHDIQQWNAFRHHIFHAMPMEPRHSTTECLQTPYIPCNAYGTTTFNNGMPSDTIYSMQCLWNHDIQQWNAFRHHIFHAMPMEPRHSTMECLQTPYIYVTLFVFTNQPRIPADNRKSLVINNLYTQICLVISL